MLVSIEVLNNSPQEGWMEHTCIADLSANPDKMNQKDASATNKHKNAILRYFWSFLELDSKWVGP